MNFEALAAECRSASFRYVPRTNCHATQSTSSICRHVTASLHPTETSLWPSIAVFPPPRASLSLSPVWSKAAETVNTCVQQLQAEIQSVGCVQSAGNDVQDAGTEEEDDGLSYAFRVDRKNPTAESLQDDFSPPKPVVADVGQAISQVEAVTAVFRFLRNACAACSDNQNACQDTGLIKLVRLWNFSSVQVLLPSRCKAVLMSCVM